MNFLPFYLGAAASSIGATGKLINATGKVIGAVANVKRNLRDLSEMGDWDDIDDNLSIKDVATLLGVSTQTVRRKIVAGEFHPEITSNKTGYIFDKDELLSYAEEHSRELNVEDYWRCKRNELAHSKDTDVILQDTFSAKLGELSNVDKKTVKNNLLAIYKGLQSEYDGLISNVNLLNAQFENKEDREYIMQLETLKLLIANKKHDISLCELYLYDAGVDNISEAVKNM